MVRWRGGDGQPASAGGDGKAKGRVTALQVLDARGGLGSLWIGGVEAEGKEVVV